MSKRQKSDKIVRDFALLPVIGHTHAHTCIRVHIRTTRMHAPHTHVHGHAQTTHVYMHAQTTHVFPFGWLSVRTF